MALRTFVEEIEESVERVAFLYFPYSFRGPATQVIERGNSYSRMLFQTIHSKPGLRSFQMLAKAKQHNKKLACTEMNSTFYDVLKLKKAIKFKSVQLGRQVAFLQ